MSAVVMAALGGLAGAGAFLMVAGLRGTQVFGGGSPALVRRLVASMGTARAALSAGLAAIVLVATGWVAGALLAAAAVVFGPRLLGGRAGREASIARTEAIAAWTEMVRDSIAAASGLEEAITATAPVAPAAIRTEVTVLVRRLEHQSLPAALASFGEEVAHPSADLVVAALTIAARMEASDMTARHALKCPLDGQPFVGHVEIGPLETDDFAAAHPGVGGDVKRGVKPLCAGSDQEHRQLLCGPGVGRPHAGTRQPDVGGAGDVALDQLALAGGIEGGSDDHVDLEHGLGRQPGAVSTAAGGERGVEIIEVVDPQPSQGDVSDRRDDVAVDEPGVAVGGGGPHLAPLLR